MGGWRDRIHPKLMASMDDCAEEWGGCGAFVDASGAVLPRLAVGCCSAQLGPIVTNGVDFLLETHCMAVSGSIKLVQAPFAWGVVGSDLGVFLSSKMISEMGWPLCVASPACIADWSGANERLVRAQSELWWDSQEQLYCDVEKYMVKARIL